MSGLRGGAAPAVEASVVVAAEAAVAVVAAAVAAQVAGQHRQLIRPQVFRVCARVI